MLRGFTLESKLIGGPSKFMLAQENFFLEETLNEKHTAFAEFIAQYGRSYASKDTAEERFEIFSVNYDKIMAHNSNEDKTYEMGFNSFSDMTNEELHSRYFSGKLRAPKRSENAVPHLRQTNLDQADLPKEVNWDAEGKVSPSVD